MKCEICGSKNVKEYPNFVGAEDYGDFHYVCKDCGAIGDEIFGHGIGWSTRNIKICSFQDKCEDFCKKCSTCTNKHILQRKSYYAE